MSDFNTLPIGLKIGTQLPLNAKTRSESESVLKDLGEFNHLAYTYEDGLNVRCILEGTSYTWREVKSIEPTPGLLPVAFTYPLGITAGGIIYDNKSFNFFGERLITTAEINKLNSLVNGGGSGGSGDGTDTFISSGTFLNGTLSLINNLGGSINITGFSTGSTGGGDQNLQSVLGNGSEVTYDNFNSNAQLFGSIPNNRSTYINHGNSLQSSGIDLSNSRFKATSNLNSGKFSSLTLANGIIELQQDDFTASPLKSTIVNMVTPVANTVLRFPAKSIGTYTLATLSDIPTPQDISGKQNILTLTNFGTSGNATLTGSILNIPNYVGGAGGAGGGTVVNLSATNGTGQTFTITNPTTTPNITLTLTNAAVGLENVPNTDFTSLVLANTNKISFDDISSTRLSNTSGTNTGDQNLQSVLNNGNTASVNGGNNFVNLLKLDKGYYRTTLSTSDGGDPYAQLDIFRDNVGLYQRSLTGASSMGLGNDGVELTKNDLNLGTTTTIKIADPLTSTQIYFPAKSIGGAYTVAMTSDISGENTGTNTGDQDLSGKVDKVTGKRLIDAAEITKLGLQSGTNTGDQNLTIFYNKTEIDTTIANIFNVQSRIIDLSTNNNINLIIGEDFIKICSANQVFTILNPILRKAFRLKLTGGNLLASFFTGYTINFIGNSSLSDYTSALDNYLYCEIRSANQIFCFFEA